MDSVLWKVWRDGDPCDSAGVYALCASESTPKLLAEDEASILYVGCSTCLSHRIGTATKDGDFSHHLLQHVAKRDEDELGGHAWKFPKFRDPARNRIWNKQWSTIILYHPLSEEHLYQSELNTWEAALLVHHFFRFGQYPPLNFKVPSLVQLTGAYYQRWYAENESYFDDSYKQMLKLVRSWRGGA